MKEKKYFIATAAVLVCIMAVVIFCAMYSEDEWTGIRFREPVRIAGNWETESGEIIQLPKTFSNAKETDISLTHYLTEDIPYGYGLMFHTAYCIYRVYLNDELIWSYGVEKQLPFGRMLGNIRAIVPLPEGVEKGAKLTLVFTPQYRLAMATEAVMIGQIGALEAYVLHENVWRIAVCLLFAVLAAAALFFGIARYENGLDFSSISFIYLGLFVAALGFWLLCDSDLPQFMTNANVAVSLMSFSCLSVVGALYMAFCAQVFRENKKMFHSLESIGYALSIIVLLLFVGDVMDPPETLIMIHIYLFSVIIVSIVYVSVHLRGREDIRRMRMAMTVLFITAIVAIAAFWFTPGSQYPAIVFAIGFFVFSVLLFAMLLEKEVSLLKQGVSASIYKEMAYHDALTGLANRAAFEKDMELVAGQAAYKPEVLLFMFDLNGLKQANDNIGHHAGDMLITGAAECLRETFEPAGKCYRLGGDEFAALLVEPALSEQQYKEKLKKVIDIQNEKTSYPISLACGFAKCRIDGMDPNFRRTVVQEADRAMYCDKELAHAAMCKEREKSCEKVALMSQKTLRDED